MLKTILVLPFVLFAGLSPGICADDRAEQWIVVTPPEFQSSLQPLCDQRRSQGLQVQTVTTSDLPAPEQIDPADGSPLRDHIHQLCREFSGTSYVLLVGTAAASESDIGAHGTLPSLPGTAGRMQGQLTDNGFGCLDQSLMPSIAVGRFPARSADEVRQMVEKTLRFERDRVPGQWRNRLTLLVGNPGGSSVLERRFASWFVQQVAGARFARVSPSWTGRAVVHAPGSPFLVPDQRLREISLRYLQEGQLFAFYLGHSSASGLWSSGAPFLSRPDFSRLTIPQGAGVLFTGGCFACQRHRRSGDGYGMAAIRNPQGPVAVFGAYGESYACMAQLALDGLLGCLSQPELPTRLGGYWLATKAGLAGGEIDSLSFMLYDQGDGSRGTVPLPRQRLEHLEMWTLLGDPALQMPPPPRPIRLTASGDVIPGQTIAISGRAPDVQGPAMIQLTLERPLGSTPAETQPSAQDTASETDILMNQHYQANSVVLQHLDIPLRDGCFEQTLTLPDQLPWSHVIVRATAEAESAAGVLSLQLPQ